MELSYWARTAQPWSDILEGCRWAADNGWHGVWVPDHFMLDLPVGDVDDGELFPYLESWTVQAALAAAVPRVRIGAMVASTTFRHPALVAKMAGTIDEVSAGRCVVGLGAGWQQNEHRRYGIELGDPSTRSDRLEEAAAVIRALLDRDRTDFSGAHYELADAPCAPAGYAGRRIPLLIAGPGEQRTLRTVARHADEWNAWADPWEVPDKRAVISRWCEEIERDPDEIRITVAAMTRFCDAEAEAEGVRKRLGNHGGLVGTVDQIRQSIADYAKAGVDELVVPDFNWPVEQREDTLSRLQAEVRDVIG